MAFYFDQKDFQFDKTCTTAPIKVLWWNIQYGKTSRYILDPKSSLDKNLTELIHSPYAPDVMAFGEYDNTSLLPETYTLFKKHYPHSLKQYFAYNPSAQELGVMVFSKLPLRLKKSSLVDYHPIGETNAKKIKNYKSFWAKGFPPERLFARTYLNFEVEHSSGKFDLIPFHALTPFEKEFKQNSWGKLGKLAIVLKNSLGSNNPLANQLTRVRREMEKSLGPKLDQSAAVVVGDFNIPPKFYVETRPYKIISQGLVDPFRKKRSATWPARSSAENQLVESGYQFDWGFLTNHWKKQIGQVIPFMGSDHYPLLLCLSL